jgi:hypothetical protein
MKRGYNMKIKINDMKIELKHGLYELHVNNRLYGIYETAEEALDHWLKLKRVVCAYDQQEFGQQEFGQHHCSICGRWWQGARSAHACK